MFRFIQIVSCLSWLLFLPHFYLLTLRLQTTFSFPFLFSHNLWVPKSVILTAVTAIAGKFGIMKGPENQV